MYKLNNLCYITKVATIKMYVNKEALVRVKILTRKQFVLYIDLRHSRVVKIGNAPV